MTRGGRTFCFSHPPGLSLWPQQPPLVHCCRRKPTLALPCAVGRRGPTALSPPTPTGGVAAPGQGGCSGWKAEDGRARTGTGSFPGSQMLSCTCSHWVSPLTSSQPRSDVQPCAPVRIHLVLCEPCHPSFLMVPQTGNPMWTGVSELRSSCALKREDLGKDLGDGQRREGVVGSGMSLESKVPMPEHRRAPQRATSPTGPGRAV